MTRASLLALAFAVLAASAMPVLGADATSAPAKPTTTSKPVAAAPAAAPAATPAAGAPAPEQDPVEAWIEQTKHPTTWLSWGADERLRDEYLHNNTTLNNSLPNNERHYQRYRTRVWATITAFNEDPTGKNPMAQRLDVNTRFVWEFRNYCLPNNPLPSPSGFSWVQGFNGDEVVMDIANVKWTNMFGLPVTGTFGRQEIIKDDGWLILDGTPLDGSRTIFFDAIRVTAELKEIKTTVDTAFIANRAREDSYIHPFNNLNRYTSEQDEMGAYAWVTNRSIQNMELGGFFIWKQDVRELANGRTGNLFTFGPFINGKIGEHWKYDAKLAKQLGHENGQANDAWAAKAMLTYLFNDPMNNQLRIAYEFLQGDAHRTGGTNEGFDILWGRWPQWSELYANAMAIDTGGRPAAYTNLHRVQFGWSIFPVKQVEIAADYHLLFSDTSSGPNANFTANGDFRGQLATLLVRWNINKHIKTHVLGELFSPGDYYTKRRGEQAAYLRYEIVLSW